MFLSSRYKYWDCCFFDDNGNNDKKYEDISRDDDKYSGEDSNENHQTILGYFSSS